LAKPQTSIPRESPPFGRIGSLTQSHRRDSGGWAPCVPCPQSPLPARDESTRASSQGSERWKPKNSDTDACPAGCSMIAAPFSGGGGFFPAPSGPRGTIFPPQVATMLFFDRSHSQHGGAEARFFPQPPKSRPIFFLGENGKRRRDCRSRAFLSPLPRWNGNSPLFLVFTMPSYEEGLNTISFSLTVYRQLRFFRR